MSGSHDSAFVCNLNALTPEEREQHTANAESLFNSVREVHELPDGYAFCLPADLLIRTAAFVQYERLCCPFFRFTLESLPNDKVIWLKLTGSEGIKPFIRAEMGGLLSAEIPIS